MVRQPDMFAAPIRPPEAPAGRTGPRLWVRRLAILKNPDTFIRDVILRPGLNIIWTPDMASSGNSSLAHGSGKTTFCRLLRACLGEPEFATEEQHRRISSQLPQGLVAAEVLIDGICWVAVRPLGLRSSQFVVQMGSIEEALTSVRREDDRSSLDPILIGAFFSGFAGITPPEVAPEQVWDVLRAWLTRDQECRLADILSWRSPRTYTRSRAQALGETAKLTMVRLALRALDAEEQGAAARERELVAAAENERRRQAYREQSHAESLSSIRAALGVEDDVGFEDAIGRIGLVSLAERALTEAIRVNLPAPPDIGSLFTRLHILAKSRGDLEVRQQQSENEVRFKRGEAERFRAEANLGQIDITQGKVRICPICKVRIDDVKARGCGISLEQCDLAALKAEIEGKQKRARDLDEEASNAEQEANRIAALINQIEPKLRALEKEVQEADAANRLAQTGSIEVQDRIYRARRTLDEVRELRDSEAVVKPLRHGTDELETVRAQLDQGRSRARAAIKMLEEKYQGVMADWLPEGVEGAIKLDGNGLKVDAQFSGRGEVSTAALDSLKVVAFDLAALQMAIEEKADLPAFLIHDSPREADLDGQLYARLFILLQQWELKVVTPCFQYIVTTTSAPPLELQNDLYVRLRMSSTPATERLFGMDL